MQRSTTLAEEIAKLKAVKIMPDKNQPYDLTYKMRSSEGVMMLDKIPIIRRDDKNENKFIFGRGAGQYEVDIKNETLKFIDDEDEPFTLTYLKPSGSSGMTPVDSSNKKQRTGYQPQSPPLTSLPSVEFNHMVPGGGSSSRDEYKPKPPPPRPLPSVDFAYMPPGGGSSSDGKVFSPYYKTPPFTPPPTPPPTPEGARNGGSDNSLSKLSALKPDAGGRSHRRRHPKTKSRRRYCRQSKKFKKRKLKSRKHKK